MYVFYQSLTTGIIYIGLRLILYHLEVVYQIQLASLNMFCVLDKSYMFAVVMTSLKFRNERSVKMVMVVSMGIKDVRNLQSPMEK